MFSPDRGKLRLSAAAVLAVLGVCVVTASSASAGDTFYLNNNSSSSLSGVSDYGGPNYNIPNDMSSCVTGPWPGPNATAYTFGPGTSGSLFLTEDLFDAYCYSDVNPQSFSVESPQDNGGGFWAPRDPLIGDATLTCAINGSTNPVVTATVNGLKCNVADAAGAPAATFVSSAAPIRGNSAVALVQHFPGSRSGTSGKPVSGVHRLTISDEQGKVLGRTRVKLVSGKPKSVRISMPKKLRKQVAKSGSVEVDATLKRVDGKPGTGDRAVLVLTQDDENLPF